MARYIDADKLFRYVDEQTHLSKGKLQNYIRDNHTADVVEVKHGEWEEWYPPKEYIMTGEEMLYRCSVCDAKYEDVEGYKHCPYCGAKMDGRSDDNNDQKRTIAVP